jgi:predicted alpha-1,2-mannosidase
MGNKENLMIKINKKLISINKILFCISILFPLKALAVEPVELVYPTLDSANSRWFFFDSASTPFGLVNLSPDTEVDGAWGSGYRYNDKEIKGFSHVHAWQLSALSVMPSSSKLPLNELKKDFSSPFDHKNESIKPGYHQVFLDRPKINVELTATTRVGFHRYEYANGKPQQVVFNLGGKMGPSQMGHSEAYQIDKRSIAGYVTNEATHRRSKPTKVYFFAQLNSDISQIDAWDGDKNFIAVNGKSGKDAGLVVTLKNSKTPVLMKVGISYVSAENAKLNLDTEIPHWDFDAIVKQTSSQWNEQLKRISIKGGSEKQQRRFYTDLWHSLQGRRIISDVNGDYTDQTGLRPVTRTIPKDENGKPLFTHHNSDSFWGAQWTISTLWPLAYPEVSSNFVNSLLLYARDGGMIPRGPSGGNYTYVMTGASSTPFIVSNYMKGIRDFDVDFAYKKMKLNHSSQGIMAKAGYEHFTNTGGGMKYYENNGYIPYPLPEDESRYGNHRRGTGQTLENAFQDFTLSQMSASLGKKEDADYYSKRSQNYQNVFDTETGFMRPRNVDGSWQTPFDPYQYENGFVESNPAQSTWFVPHDIKGLAKLMGGETKLVDKLDNAFVVAEKQGFTAGTAHAHEALAHNRRVPINYGNQPSMQTAFIFNAAGAPWKTQYWSRKVVDTVFSDLSPERGYNGDEDQGLMGSLAVLMKIGLFQLTAGTEEDPVYWLGSPLFDQIDIALSNKYYSGKTFTIKTINNSASSPYIKSIKLNGKTLHRAYLLHSEIINGGLLELTMSKTPNKHLTKTH